MKRKAGKIFSYCLVGCLAFIALFPIFALLLASFKPSTELLQYGLNLNLQPDMLTLNNYTSIFTGGGNYLAWYRKQPDGPADCDALFAASVFHGWVCAGRLFLPA